LDILDIDDVYNAINCSGPCGPGSYAAASSAAVVDPGPNGVLETCPEGDDYVNPASPNTILAGINKRVDSIVQNKGDDRMGLIAAGNKIAESGIAGDGIVGDDVQIVSASLSVPYTFPIVSAGPNGVLETLRLGDDVEMIYDVNWPPGVADTLAQGDDVQVVPVGQPTFVNLGGNNYILPVILPGPDGVIDEATKLVLDSSESLVIGEYGPDGVIENLLTAAGYPPVVGYPVPGDVPAGNGVGESGLGGRGSLDALLGCVNIDGTLDNGGVPGVDDPLADPARDYTECKERVPDCPDDCQIFFPGNNVGSSGAQVIDAGDNGLIDTPRVGDDSEAIVDGGNGIAESGRGDDDKQVIPAGQGEPDAIAIIAERCLPPYPADCPARVLNTTVLVGDDRLVDPGKNALAGNLDFTPDDNDTEPDPDEDERIENYATVDDGEYFSWETTNVDTALFAPPVNVPVAFGGITSELTYQVMSDPAGGATGLIAYVSDGRDIYRLISNDGVTWNWDPVPPVLIAGDNGKASDPVVMAGIDGICDTAAMADDVQAIPVGQGKPNSIAIFIGLDGIFQSVPAGDDKRDGLVIRTGPDGICDTAVGGDDWEILTIGKGQPDAACILAGQDGKRNTDDPLVNDDRQPFLDVNKNSETVPGPESGVNEDQVDVGDEESSGFDAFAVTHPFVFRHEGTWYMFYTGWGALSEPEGKRADKETLEKLGPCMRPGLNRSTYYLDVNDPRNLDNTPEVVVGPRIGLATSSNGIVWRKKKMILGLGNECSALAGMSIPGVIEMEELGDTAVDFSGALGARIRSDADTSGEPVFSMVYTGLGFFRNKKKNLVEHRVEPFYEYKPKVGLARSFDINSGWTRIKDYSPVFPSPGMLEGGEFADDSSVVVEVGDGYQAFYAELDYDDNSYYISVAKRFGSVYGLCMTVGRVVQDGGAYGRALMGILIILLPAVLLLTRKAWLGARKRR